MHRLLKHLERVCRCMEVGKLYATGQHFECEDSVNETHLRKEQSESPLRICEQINDLALSHTSFHLPVFPVTMSKSSSGKYDCIFRFIFENSAIPPLCMNFVLAVRQNLSQTRAGWAYHELAELEGVAVVQGKRAGSSCSDMCAALNVSLALRGISKAY